MKNMEVKNPNMKGTHCRNTTLQMLPIKKERKENLQARGFTGKKVILMSFFKQKAIFEWLSDKSL